MSGAQTPQSRPAWLPGALRPSGWCAIALLASAALLAGCAALTPPEPGPPGGPGTAAATPADARAVEPAALPASAREAPAAADDSEIGVAADAPTGPGADDVDLAGTGAEDRGDLWQRVRDGFAIDDLADATAVQRWRGFYADRASMVSRLFERGSPYLFHIVEEVDRRGMPMELALLPFIESAFDPQAVSRAQAAGMWQFIPSTGRAFDLQQNAFRDERRDVIASTRAALDYLQQLHARFGDWHFALAAYNWGEGNVQRAQRLNAHKRRPTDYARLRMPDETRQYVPKLLAVRDLVRDPSAFGIELPALENHPWFLAVQITRDIDLALAASLAGLDEQAFRRYNPQLEPPLILAAGTPRLLLPYDAAQRFAHALAALDGPLASWTAWVAPRTLTVAEAARLTGVSEEVLRSVNRIPPRMKLARGSTLLVPRGADVGEDVAVEVADHGALDLVPELPLRRVVLRVGAKGDTVAGVARRYRLDARDVARWNKVSPKARFRAGARVVVMLPPRASRTASVPVRQASTKGTAGTPGKATSPPTATKRKPAR